uniref:Uncharacterized protein n=1 Tax=Populus trichocarpa TaxID=3694 RepID=A9P8G0_POPTR|nr:unknown [Populus trichocarpa]
MRGIHERDLHACSCKYHAWDRGKIPRSMTFTGLQIHFCL